MLTFRFSPLGDSALTITLGDSISVALSERVVACASRIRAAGFAGVSDVVPAYAALTVYFDPLLAKYEELRSRLDPLLRDGFADESPQPSGRLHTIAVRYDGDDLDDVGKRTGLTPEEVIRLHTAAAYRVFVLGFVPGFAYLGILDERLSLPRRDAPRKRVPAGSVAIAERQTAVYPLATPGGWHLIGTTTARMFDAGDDPPALLRAGDRVRFEAIV